MKNEDYLMMWFRRPEFDRICWLHTDGRECVVFGKIEL